jgi:hypothetical protein
MAHRSIDPAARARQRLAAHRFGWVAESLVDEPSFLLRPMFGCLACYLHGRLMLLLADRTPPWCGVILPTERDAHAAICEEFPVLRPHPVLSKWLVLRESADCFDEVAERLAEHCAVGDQRLGVEPKPKKRGRSRKPRPRTQPSD